MKYKIKICHPLYYFALHICKKQHFFFFHPWLSSNNRLLIYEHCMLKHSQMFLTTTRAFNFVKYFYINISCHAVLNLVSELKRTICNSWNLYLLYLPIFFAIKRRRICFFENVEYLNLISSKSGEQTGQGLSQQLWANIECTTFFPKLFVV